jgi:hypothetical protein
MRKTGKYFISNSKWVSEYQIYSLLSVINFSFITYNPIYALPRNEFKEIDYIKKK